MASDDPITQPQRPVWRATAPPVAPVEPHRPGRFDDEDRPAVVSATTVPRRVPVRRRGRGWVVLATVFAAACWVVWLAYDLSELGSAGEPLRGLALAGVASVAAYWLTRLGGHLIRTAWERGPRTSTLIPNLVTACFIGLCGIAFLSRTPFAVGALWGTLSGNR